MIRRLLIANRGEIAVRIARTARERGILTIAVHSDVDRDALHVRVCARAVEIGPAPAPESYLNVGAILEAARAARADAIHPGYGFLSEDAGFAEAVVSAGLCWVGPSPDSMRKMGDKVTSRSLLERAGVPVVPGFQQDRASDEDFVRAAARLGYPVLVKASGGGGGKGMRFVDRAEDLPSALAAARREARAAFRNSAVYLEKAIPNPRHVEIQILGDGRGRVVPLSERECSIQRRHQKIVEETPCVSLDDGTRRRMCEAAAAAGEAVAYAGAGTVEFLVDEGGAFHFLEMNTRLQVEHPITEEILGIDLVAAQLDVAEERARPEAWAALRPRGHAIEARLYAEDPVTYLPRSGTILAYEEPRGPGVRMDSGIEKGSRVGIEYDPILAKIVVRAEGRASAIARMKRALAETVVLGVATNLELLARVVESPDFAAGRAAVRGAATRRPGGGRSGGVGARSCPRPACPLGRGGCLPGPLGLRRRKDPLSLVRLRLEDGEQSRELDVDLGDEAGAGVRSIEAGGEIRALEIAGEIVPVRAVRSGGRVFVWCAGRVFEFALGGGRGRRAAASAGLEGLWAPMPGKILDTRVREGETVRAGQTLLILEAMKMEHEIRAPRAGRVGRLPFRNGDQVETGALLVEFAG
jgi:acetyl/propionyl-CoA carboxylase alpha subunit